jgi:hypothetical protein
MDLDHASSLDHLFERRLVEVVSPLLSLSQALNRSARQAFRVSRAQ